MERATHQRQAICESFEHAGRPLGPREVLELAQQSSPGLGVATVYRTIKALVTEGRLQPVELPGEPARYEMAGKAHHHHFRCRRCHKVYEIQGCPGNLKSLVPRGFTLENHEMVLYGLCSHCH